MSDRQPATITEAAREIAIIDRVDVLVCGGGPAGIAAAVASAREGARTLLVERYGYLGGMITGTNVIWILGPGNGYRQLAQGIVSELHERMAALGAATPIRESSRDEQAAPGSGDYRVDNETFKWQAVELLHEAGADLLLETQVCQPIIADGRVLGVLVENKSGRQAILAEVTIDCTADADLAYRAGCPCDNETHEVDLQTQVEGVDTERTKVFETQEPEAYARIVAEGLRLNGGAWPGRPRHYAGVDVADAAELTRAQIVLRRELFQALRYLREHLPGWEEAHVARTFPQFGVRQGRRIRGAYLLRDEDLVASRHFEDGIARMGTYFPDWGPTYAIKGLEYDIPYRCLVPQNVEGLLVAGRCISADYVACNTMRLIAPCLVTGQAAGVAAALASEFGRSPRAVPVDTLRQALRDQGANVG